MNVWLIILLMILIIIFVIVVYYFIRTKIIKIQNESWPPKQYMLETGAQCPDYWYIFLKNKNNVVCKSIDDINSKNNTVKVFPKVTKWPPKYSQLKPRCQWIKNNTTTWLGIKNLC